MISKVIKAYLVIRESTNYTEPGQNSDNQHSLSRHPGSTLMNDDSDFGSLIISSRCDDSACRETIYILLALQDRYMIVSGNRGALKHPRNVLDERERGGELLQLIKQRVGICLV